MTGTVQRATRDTGRGRHSRLQSSAFRDAMVTSGAVLVGAALVCWAYALARHATGQAHFAVFWVGYLLGAGALLRAGLLARRPAWHRAGWLAVFALFTFLPKFLMSSQHAVYYDEYGHWRHAEDLLASGNLFASNSYLPIVRYYPGLSSVTAAVHEVTRLSTWHSGQLVVLAGHAASLPIVAAIVRRTGAGPRMAYAAAFVFALNPSFLYFDTQYGYESLGLPLALGAVLCALAARQAAAPAAAWRRCAAGAALALATIVTHHVSAIVMAAVCIVVAAVVPVRAEAARRAASFAAWGVAAVAAAGTSVWVGVVARDTSGYLDPHLSGAFRQVFAIAGIGSAAADDRHTPFSTSAAPPYERFAAFAMPVLVLAVTALGARSIWRARRSQPGLVRLTAPFIGLAALYFASLPFTLTAAGGELAHRSWPFCFVGVAVLAAHTRPWLRAGLRRPAAAAVAVVCCVGGVAAGQNVDYRFPGPYRFGSDTRSGSAELSALVAWADRALPAGAGVVTDRFTGEAVTGYTRLRVPSPQQGAVNLIYAEPTDPSPALRSVLRDGHFDYLVLDHRVGVLPSSQPPFAGYGPDSVNVRAFATMAPSAFLTPVHRSENYTIYRIDPDGAA